jgi:DNA polymerase-3 subunit epsilon
MRARRYRWAGEESGLKRAWWKDVRESDQQAEVAWLRSEVYGRDDAVPTICTIDARNRFSARL